MSDIYSAYYVPQRDLEDLFYASGIELVISRISFHGIVLKYA